MGSSEQSIQLSGFIKDRISWSAERPLVSKDIAHLSQFIFFVLQEQKLGNLLRIEYNNCFISVIIVVL